MLVAGAMIFCSSSKGQTKIPSADEMLKPAYAKAKKENKAVLVIFHASWCGWCRKMDASLNDKGIAPLINKNFETVHLTVYESQDKKDSENPGALELLTKHGGADQGLPYWFVFDKNGKKLADSQYKPGENTGCPATEEEVDHWISVLKKTTSLKQDDLEKIRKRFRKNEI
jgi:thioredoxin-related protein